MLTNKQLTGLIAFAFVLLLLVFWNTCQAATLSWDKTDEPDLVGWNIYYSNPAEDQFNKTIYVADVSANSTRVVYEDFESKLQLQYNIEYTLMVTAFDVGQESDMSNSATYTRIGYSPPIDALPSIIIHASGPITITIEN